MQRAYIYMEHPESGQVVTLGRLSLKGRLGEFVYAPEYVAQDGWVPDPIHYPLGTCASRSLCHLPRGCGPGQRMRSGEQ
ncbi:hypothetical protein I5O09_14200 [Pseudomonas parafulva]|uniref:hypothetical protein n=1 Tax=Pseudomonas TaxID=286 RepID=UPI0018D690CB|nr:MULTISPECIES: hypothetical protein [Pseudomonas]MBH3344896.1 hypothetical protein [Pseudomonas parafulva]MEC4021878.1 hypothetical protein [Pseudomonas fulva]